MFNLLWIRDCRNIGVWHAFLDFGFVTVLWLRSTKQLKTTSWPQQSNSIYPHRMSVTRCLVGWSDQPRGNPQFFVCDLGGGKRLYLTITSIFYPCPNIVHAVLGRFQLVTYSPDPVSHNCHLLMKLFRPSLPPPAPPPHPRFHSHADPCPTRH